MRKCRSISTQQYILLGTASSYPAKYIAGYEDAVPSNLNVPRVQQPAGTGRKSLTDTLNTN